MRARAYNFGAGPAMMPDAVIERIAREWQNFRGEGYSAMELGHRSEHFAEQLLSLTERGPTPVQPVHVCGVDQVHPRIEGSLHQAGGRVPLVTHETPVTEGKRTHFSEPAQRARRSDVQGQSHVLPVVDRTLV